MLPWTSFTCYTKDNQQECFRLSNWLSLRRLGPWMNHLPPCMIVHFSAHISKWELVCKFGVIFHIFIISCLCSRFHVWNQGFFFYSVITFSYTKCFVHSYTVDVIFTLSYTACCEAVWHIQKPNYIDIQHVSNKCGWRNYLFSEWWIADLLITVATFTSSICDCRPLYPMSWSPRVSGSHCQLG